MGLYGRRYFPCGQMILPGRRFGRTSSVLGAHVNRPLRSRLPFHPPSLRTRLLLPLWLCRLLPKRFLSLCSRSRLHLSQRLHLSSLSPSRLHLSPHMSPWFRLGRLLLCSFFRPSSLHRPSASKWWCYSQALEGYVDFGVLSLDICLDRASFEVNRFLEYHHRGCQRPAKTSSPFDALRGETVVVAGRQKIPPATFVPPQCLCVTFRGSDWVGASLICRHLSLSMLYRFCTCCERCNFFVCGESLFICACSLCVPSWHNFWRNFLFFLCFSFCGGGVRLPSEVGGRCPSV